MCAFYQGAYFSPDQTKNVLGNLFEKNTVSREPESSKLLQTVEGLSQLGNRVKASAGIKPTDLAPARMLGPLRLGSEVVHTVHTRCLGKLRAGRALLSSRAR